MTNTPQLPQSLIDAVNAQSDFTMEEVRTVLEKIILKLSQKELNKDGTVTIGHDKLLQAFGRTYHDQGLTHQKIEGILKLLVEHNVLAETTIRRGRSYSLSALHPVSEVEVLAAPTETALPQDEKTPQISTDNTPPEDNPTAKIKPKGLLPALVIKGLITAENVGKPLTWDAIWIEFKRGFNVTLNTDSGNIQIQPVRLKNRNTLNALIDDLINKHDVEQDKTGSTLIAIGDCKKFLADFEKEYGTISATPLQQPQPDQSHVNRLGAQVAHHIIRTVQRR